MANRRARIACHLGLALGAALFGCRRETTTSTVEPTCNPEKEVRISHLENGEVRHFRCIPMPSACSRQGGCQESCKQMLSTQCDQGWKYVACADMEKYPLIVSCNRE